MAKPNIAKEEVITKIKQVFGEDYIGESANKHYVWAKGENGKVQIAISLTQPKVQLGEAPTVSFDGGIDFDAPQVVTPTKFEPAEVTQEEKDNISELFAKLGL